MLDMYNMEYLHQEPLIFIHLYPC